MPLPVHEEVHAYPAPGGQCMSTRAGGGVVSMTPYSNHVWVGVWTTLKAET